MPVVKVICCSSQKSNQKNYMRSLITIKKISKLSDALGDIIILNAAHGKKNPIKLYAKVLNFSAYPPISKT